MKLFFSYINHIQLKVRWTTVDLQISEGATAFVSLGMAATEDKFHKYAF